MVCPAFIYHSIFRRLFDENISRTKSSRTWRGCERHSGRLSFLHPQPSPPHPSNTRAPHQSESLRAQIINYIYSTTFLELHNINFQPSNHLVSTTLCSLCATLSNLQFTLLTVSLRGHHKRKNSNDLEEFIYLAKIVLRQLTK